MMLTNPSNRYIEPNRTITMNDQRKSVLSEQNTAEDYFKRKTLLGNLKTNANPMGIDAQLIRQRTKENLERLKRPELDIDIIPISDGTREAPRTDSNRPNNDGDEIEKLIKKQERENELLKMQIDAKRKNTIINANDKTSSENQVTSNRSHMNLVERYQPQVSNNVQQPARPQLINAPLILNQMPRSNFIFDEMVNQNFLLNKARNLDLNLYERYMCFIQAQEVDDLRILERSPVGTDLYHFKLEQYKDSSTVRAEIMKLVHEQSLKELRKAFEDNTRERDNLFDNKVWVDEYRKKIIGTRIRRDLGPEPMLYVDKPEMNQATGSSPNLPNNNPMYAEQAVVRQRGYDPMDGFIVYWDYIIGINNANGKVDLTVPKGIQLIVSVVCEGSTIIEPFKVEPRDLEFETYKSLKTVFACHDELTNVFINPDTLMIWEIQIVDKSNPDSYTAIGWTQIDLFELSRDLKRGFWKCPIYTFPVDLGITKEKVQLLAVELGPWIYLRIAYPWVDQYTEVESLDPNLTAGKYFIPEMHLRAAYYKAPIEVDYRQQVKYIENKQSAEFQPLNPNNNPQYMRPTTTNLMTDTNNSNNESTNSLPRGVKIVVHKLKNHIAASHLKIAVAIVEDRNKVYDDNGKDCVRNTTIHNPLVSNFEAQTLKQMNSSIGNSLYTSNKAEGKDIVFNEDFLYLRNFPIMFARNNQELNIVFQVIEKPEPKNILDTKKIGYNSNRTDNFAGMEYKLYAWTHFKLLNNNGRIRNGTFTARLCKPPYKLPPIDLADVPPSESEIEFTLVEYQYDKKDLEKQLKAKNKTNTTSNTYTSLLKKEIQLGDQDVKIDNRPFIPNSKPQYTDKQFVKGYGVDFYIDGARFLPDNVTVSKIILRFINKDFVEQFDPPVITLLPRFGHPTFSPVFDFRHELRTEYFDSSMMAFMTIITRDKSCNENRIVGYSAINLFINRFSKQQPESSNDADVVLYNGNYELPIIGDEPLRTKPFNMEKLMRYNKLPASSLLVRIRLAPLSDDWKRVLTIKDFPKTEWKARGLWVPRPLYASGAYNNALKTLKENEIDLYAFRQSRPDVVLRETALLLVQSANINKDMIDKELFEWCDSSIQIDQTSKLIDPMFFAKYQPQSGFKFILDGVNNAPDNPVVGIYSLNPPGAFYTQNDSSKLVLNALVNWDSPIGQTIFFDKWYYFKDIEFEEKMHIIVELKAVKVKDGEPFFENFAWTIVPIFHERGYTLNGNFQIPLFDGEVKPPILDEISTSEKSVWETVEKLVTDGKIAYKGKSSVFVRLLDCQKEGQLGDKLDIETLDYKYLPKNIKLLKEFAYNQQSKLTNESKGKIKKFIPNDGNPLDFTKKIVDFALLKYGIKDYNFDFS